MDEILEGSSIAVLGDHVAVALFLVDVDSFEYVGVVDQHERILFHREEVLGDFVVDGFEVDHFDGQMISGVHFIAFISSRNTFVNAAG